MLNLMLVIVVALFVLYGLFLRRWIIRDLPPFGTGLVITLTGIHIILLGLYVYSRTADLDLFWRWYLNYKYGEFNPTATLSTVHYLLVGVTAVVIAGFARLHRLWHRLYWLGLGLCFVFLALDEYFIIHENWGNTWIIVYGLVGAVFVAMTVLLYRAYPQSWRTYILLFGGLGIATVGAVGLEVLAAQTCFGLIPRGICGELPIFEELLENLGILTSLIAVILFAKNHTPAAVLPRVGNTVTASGLVAGFVFLGALWVVPPLELRLLAEPVQIDYAAPDLNIAGYHITKRTFHPGETFDLSVYWQKTGQVSGAGRYGLSVHIIERTSGADITGVNKLILNPQPVQARQGMLHRSTITVQLPQDIPTPASYWITLATWQEQGEDYAMQTINTTDRDLLTGDASILGSITVLDPTPRITVVESSRYQFMEDFSLSGYDVQQEGDGLSLQFAWEKHRDRPLTADYIQFLHLLDANGQLIVGVDQPPFAGSLPTHDWPQGLKAQAQWQVVLPDDLPAGDYRLYTGLYDPVTSERVPVTNGDGEPIPDWYIDLGEVTIGR